MGLSPSRPFISPRVLRWYSFPTQERDRPLDSLPRDLLLLVLPYLTGFDLLSLSHVDRRFYVDLLGSNSEQWRSRVAHGIRLMPGRWYDLAKGGWFQYVYDGGSSTVPRPTFPPEFSAKRDDVSSVSMRFHGNSGVYSTISPRMIRRLWVGNNVSFSFDVWFALLPTGLSLSSTSRTTWTDSAPDVGGILLSAEALNIAHVDPLGNLYCSLVPWDKPILAKLQLQRWYHLALTFHPTTPQMSDVCQRVYLDGKLVNEWHGCLPDYTPFESVQIGCGIMDLGSVGSLRADYGGMYGFNGLVDDFRFWRGVLSVDDVQQLRVGEETTLLDRIPCAWSLMREGDSSDFYGVLSAVRCTRPMEGSCQNIRFAHRVVGDDDPNRIHIDPF